MFHKAALLLGLATILGMGSSVQAGPVALIEEISAGHGKFQPMDFLDRGTKIVLNADGTLVLGYLKSCIQEHIKGGTVLIGELQSTNSGGQIVRTQVTCQGNANISSGKKKKREAGGVVFRSKKRLREVKTKYVVNGLSPLIYLTVNSSHIFIGRMDEKGEKYKFSVRNKMVDMVKENVKLRRNTIYILETDTRSTSFIISIKARKRASLLSRLLRF